MNLSAHFSETSELYVEIERPGPFYFAYAMPGEAFDPVVHAREDIEFFSVELDQVEGDFATLKLQIKNPRIGLLAPGRKIWGWFSYLLDGVVTPMFFGRLVGAPAQIQDEVVEIDLIARPEDLTQQKIDIANEVKSYGTWDPIWYSGADLTDPDKILEAIPSLWNFDRVTHVVSLTDIANGEDGTVAFDEDHIFYDSFRQTYSQNPIRKVHMLADVSWDQIAAGQFDITRMRMSGNDRAGEHSGFITSRLGEGLVAAWPKSGESIGGGWTFTTSTINVQFGPIESSTVGQWNIDDLGRSFYMDGGFDTGLGVAGAEAPGLPVISWSYHVTIPMWGFSYQMVIGYDVNRRKTERLEFTLEADVQPTLTEPADQETLDLTMSSSEIVGQGAILPAARAFFSTSRGVQSVEYLLAIARAHLIARARAVDLQFDVPFDDAVRAGLSCRKNASVVEDRLPGGFAAGKITRYTFTVADGKTNATVYAACMIGRGGTIAPSDGVPDYCEDDYVEHDYQFFVSQFVMPSTGDVVYESIEGTIPNDDGIDFAGLTASQVVRRLQLLNNFNDNDGTQEEALTRFNVQVDSATGRIISALTAPPPQVVLELVDLTGGPFEMDYQLATSLLVIPKTIDLETAYE
jgi:hypothetical protein